MTSNTATIETGVGSDLAHGERGEQGAGDAFLDRFFQRFVERRMASTERRIKAYLNRFDDAHLKRLGHSDADIADIRKYRHDATPFLL